MNTNIQDNYNILKKEMRKFLKQDIPDKQKLFLNKQLKSVIDTLQDMNKEVFDMELQSNIDDMYKTFMPYMFGYWIINEVPPIEQISHGSNT